MVSPHFPSPNVHILRILVVEDEVLIAECIRDLLTELGHECIGPFRRLEDAVHHAQTADVDAAILNLILAGKNAYAVAEILQRREIPFGFASGVPRSGLDA